MINVENLKHIFKEKLEKTSSMDSAFIKAVWVAYNAGLADGRAEVQSVVGPHGTRQPIEIK